MDELSRQEIENLDRFVSVSNMPPPQMIERLCETALAALDRADNLVFELKMLKDSAYLIKRAEEAERNDTQSLGLYRQARLRAEKAERELAAVKDQVAALGRNAIMKDVILHVQNPPPEGGYLLTGEEVAGLVALLLNISLGLDQWHVILTTDGDKISASLNTEVWASQARDALNGGKP